MGAIEWAMWANEQAIISAWGKLFKMLQLQQNDRENRFSKLVRVRSYHWLYKQTG